jgi:ketosteroid isomerase-like protein
LTGEASVGPNAAAVIRAIDAYNAGDIEGLLTMAHPDIEWEVAPEHPASTTHRGFDAVRECHEDWRNTLQDLHIELQSVTEGSDDERFVTKFWGT